MEIRKYLFTYVKYMLEKIDEIIRENTTARKRNPS